uniref:Neur_chan_LBD domain-containing protein n=1 Tax=Macrostomum lignano TaxID=282301 RepID=A0A1I8GF94_9PLAT
MRLKTALFSALLSTLLLQLLPPALMQSVHESSSADLLFSKIYDAHLSMIPPPKVNGTFNVTFDMAIAQLLELDELKQTVSMLTWRRMSWYDTRLSWRSRVFDGNLSFNSISSIKIPNSQIWKPDLVVYNDVRKTELDWSLYYASIQSDGLVRLNTPQLMKLSCPINVQLFPYDKQVCRMKIGSWTMDGFELNLLNASTHADLSSMAEDNEFCLVKAPLERNVIKYACCDAPYPDITYSILLQVNAACQPGTFWSCSVHFLR